MRPYIPSPLGKVARAERAPDEVYKVSFRNLIRLASQSNQTVGDGAHDVPSCHPQNKALLEGNAFRTVGDAGPYG